ncbi:MAG: DNA-binding protein [Bdellovibrionaceae bacterium]|nr:DNA-binding protein [Pseudobdellovibrionaceae bacterium]
MNSKIGILGSGVVGKTLSEGFIKHGYEVKQGARNKFSEIASWADLVVLAVKGSVAEEALDLAGESNLKNKTVIDVTNPIAEQPPEDGVLKFFTTIDESLIERLQSKFSDTHFVKAFNSVGSSLMVDPDFEGVKPTMFICGDKASAKNEAKEILDHFGWEVEDMGSAKAGRAIEPLCMLWCIPGFRENRWNHAFKLLKK